MLKLRLPGIYNVVLQKKPLISKEYNVSPFRKKEGIKNG